MKSAELNPQTGEATSSRASIASWWGWSAIRWALAIAGLAYYVAILTGHAGFTERPLADDVRAYWSAGLTDPYRMTDVGVSGAYLYSPAFLLLMAPLAMLPLPVVYLGFSALQIGLLAWMGVLWLLPLTPLTDTLYYGNVTIVYAVLIVIGFRFPAAWSFMLLTKVTPGIGLVWFAIRGEWRKLAIALGVTAAIVAASWILTPSLWPEWFSMLSMSAQQPAQGFRALPIPLLPRLVMAALIIAWGARADRKWTVPVGVTIASPVVWMGALAILTAVPPLLSANGWRRSSSPRAKVVLSA
jgi:hypothetical protein